MKRLSQKQLRNVSFCFIVAFAFGGIIGTSSFRINTNTNTPIIATEHASIEKQTVETYANKYRNHRNEYYGESSLVKLADDSYAHVYLNTKSFGTYQPEVKKIMAQWNKQVGYEIFKNATDGISLDIVYHPNHGISTVTDTHILQQGSYLKSLKDVNEDQITLNLPRDVKHNKKLVTKLLSLELKHCLGIKTNNIDDTTITKSDLATIYHSIELI